MTTAPDNTPPTQVRIEWIQDRYALAQVMLYIMTTGLAFQSCMQFIQASTGLPPQGVTDVMHYRVSGFVVPAIHNAMLALGAAVLSQQLNHCTVLIWRTTAAIFAAQLLIGVLGMLVQPNAIAGLTIALCMSGLYSLLSNPLPREPLRIAPHMESPDAASQER